MIKTKKIVTKIPLQGICINIKCDCNWDENLNQRYTFLDSCFFVNCWSFEAIRRLGSLQLSFTIFLIQHPLSAVSL